MYSTELPSHFAFTFCRFSVLCYLLLWSVTRHRMPIIM